MRFYGQVGNGPTGRRELVMTTNRERRLRRALAFMGLRLSKSRGDGTYTIIDVARNCVVDGPGLTLEQAENAAAERQQ